MYESVTSMFKIDILLLFYLQHGCIITKKSAAGSYLFILFPETKLFPKKHNIFNCSNAISSICFSKILN